MIYQNGDYVYPADLPRPVLCRVAKAESLDVRSGTAQVLRLEPLEGPWPPGTSLVRLDHFVVPARPRELWQKSPPMPERRRGQRPGQHAA